MQPTQYTHPNEHTRSSNQAAPAQAHPNNHAHTFAYLAPEGTYSDEAAQIFAQKMGCEAPEFVACPSFNEIYEAVERGRCEYGVLPLENSLEGAVTGTLDIFAFKGGISIVGSVIMDVHHCLLLHPQASLSDISAIVSHPQALAQCRRYLNEHFPAIPRLSTSSTADAAKKASEDPHTAAIASSFAGELFGCSFAEVGIEDHVGNQTQFVLIARKGHPSVIAGQHYTTSLVLYLEDDRPGALLMILAEFAYANVNLTKIQSRPTKQGLGNYLFFVDIDGKQDEPQVKTALDCLRMKLQEVRVLGTYPVD